MRLSQEHETVFFKQVWRVTPYRGVTMGEFPYSADWQQL